MKEVELNICEWFRLERSLRTNCGFCLGGVIWGKKAGRSVSLLLCLGDERQSFKGDVPRIKTIFNRKHKLFVLFPQWPLLGTVVKLTNNSKLYVANSLQQLPSRNYYLVRWPINFSHRSPIITLKGSSCILVSYFMPFIILWNN